MVRCKLILVFVLILNTISCLGQGNYQIETQFFNDSLITIDRVGIFKIGDKIEDNLEKFKFKKFESEYYLYGNSGDLILSIWSKDEKTIGGIMVYSTSFKTNEGIKVGMDIKSLLQVFPEAGLYSSDLTTEEYFEFEKYTREFDRYLHAYVISNNEKELGEYKDNSNKAIRFNTEGKIERIMIYNWK